MATWEEDVIADVRNGVPATIAKEVLSRGHSRFDRCKYSVHMITPPYPLWLSKVDPNRQTNLKDSIIDFRQRRDLYHEKMLELLENIGLYDVGAALLNELCSTGRDVWIRPYTIFSNDNGAGSQLFAVRDNDSMGGVSRAANADATSVGMPIYGIDGKLVGGSGNGKGADVALSFSPGQWGENASITGPGTLPDEVLFHELVHAARYMRGVVHQIPMGQGYTSTEEFVAVMLSNIFLSEKRQITLRANHEVPVRTLQNPAKFLDNGQGLGNQPLYIIERLRLEMPRLYRELAAISTSSAKFNPVRQFEERRKAGKIKF